jgi:hypothetical protein
VAAIKDALDRAGFGARDRELTINHRKFEDNMQGIFVDVVDGEVVEDAPAAALPPGAIDNERDPLLAVARSEIVQRRERRSRSSASSPTPTSR